MKRIRVSMSTKPISAEAVQQAYMGLAAGGHISEARSVNHQLRR
jgi:hypothetical protein